MRGSEGEEERWRGDIETDRGIEKQNDKEARWHRDGEAYRQSEHTIKQAKLDSPANMSKLVVKIQ